MNFIVPGYRVERLLGVGGQAEVWLGHELVTDKRVALKRIPAGTPAAASAARIEAALLAVLDHPNLIALRGCLMLETALVLVLELAEGGTLAALLNRRRRLTPPEVVATVSPVAAALAYAHDAGVVHGDVSAANILFTRAGRPKLADVGLSRVLAAITARPGGADSLPIADRCMPDDVLPGDDRFGVEELLGTPAYLDPTVAAGGPVGLASDVFSLGAVALHALTGAGPWQLPGEPAPSAEHTVAVAAGGTVPELAARLRELPAAMAEVLTRVLDPEPHRRGTAAELALDLRASLPPGRVELTGGRIAPTAARLEQPSMGGLEFVPTDLTRIPPPRLPADVVAMLRDGAGSDSGPEDGTKAAKGIRSRLQAFGAGVRRRLRLPGAGARLRLPGAGLRLPGASLRLPGAGARLRPMGAAVRLWVAAVLQRAGAAGGRPFGRPATAHHSHPAGVRTAGRHRAANGHGTGHAQTSLPARQRGLQAGRSRLPAGRSRLPAGQAVLPAGQAPAPAGQAPAPAGQAPAPAGQAALSTDQPGRRLAATLLAVGLLLAVGGFGWPQLHRRTAAAVSDAATLRGATPAGPTAATGRRRSPATASPAGRTNGRSPTQAAMSDADHAAPAGSHPAVSAAGLVRILDSLDALREQAYAQRRPELLATVYGSPALLAADARQLEHSVPVGCGLSGVHTAYHDPQLGSAAGSGVTAPVGTAWSVPVAVIASLPSATLTCHGAVRGRTAPTSPIRLRLVLSNTGDGWRIVSERRA